MGIESQEKGALGEKELCSILDSAGYPVKWGGNKTFGEVPDISGLPGIHVECKRVEALNIYKAMEQAQRDSERFGDGRAAVFQRRSGHQWLVTMSLTDWIAMYGEANGKSDPQNGERKKMSTYIEPKPNYNRFTNDVASAECVDTGRNVLTYYEKEARLNVGRPNWMTPGGETKPGKTVALYLDSIKNNPQARELLRKIYEYVMS